MVYTRSANKQKKFLFYYFCHKSSLSKPPVVKHGGLFILYQITLRKHLSCRLF
nr:MAG TPA: hypothetical protein [Caudoviricetes sp.]